VKGEHPRQFYVSEQIMGLKNRIAANPSDATGQHASTSSGIYGHFLCVGAVILIIEDFETHQPGQFEWFLHVDGKAERHDRDLGVRHGETKVLVRPLFRAPFSDAGLPSNFPEYMRLTEKPGFLHKNPETEVTYSGFQPFELTRRTKFIAAVLLVDEDKRDSLPQLER